MIWHESPSRKQYRFLFVSDLALHDTDTKIDLKYLTFILVLLNDLKQSKTKLLYISLNVHDYEGKSYTWHS